MISSAFRKDLEKVITDKANQEAVITGMHAVGGGCINESFRLETSAGAFFMKWNHAGKYPGMFEAEKKGLELLRRSDAIRIPEVIAYGHVDDMAYILMEWIAPAPMKINFWSDFGKRLAKLHQQSSATFGLDHSNYIGSLQQSNAAKNTWQEFFVSERILPQMKMAIDGGRLSRSDEKRFDHMAARLGELLPSENPALIHGDLWNGNFIVDDSGQAALIDPAVYFGHREMDLAMSRLFGGFDSAFYSGYHEEFPLTAGFEQRIGIHNLYPLLVHVNLFGGGYSSDVRSILEKFS